MALSSKIYKMELHMGDWKPHQGSGSTVITSVYRAINVRFKGSPITVENLKYLPGYPYGYIEFDIPGNQFETYNAAGLVSLSAESHYDCIGYMLVRKEDGHRYSSRTIIHKVHIRSIASGKYAFKLHMSGFDTGIDGAPLDPYAN